MHVKYRGRIFTPLVAIGIIIAWHASYFAIDQNGAYQFLIKDGFLKYDYIYTPLILPFFWWMGKKYDEARFYSERDPLTGLYNRRYVFKVFPAILDRAIKGHQTLGIFIIDVDHFKSINDTLGHEFGDAILQDVSSALKNSTGASELVARWGGDEFLVIASHANEDSYASFCNVVDENLVISGERFSMSISVSIGQALFPNDAKVPNDLIRIADARMYAVKSSKFDTNSPVAPATPV